MGRSPGSFLMFAKTKDEQDFYITLFDMVLQREQKIMLA